MISDLGTLRRFLGRVWIGVEGSMGPILPEVQDMYVDQEELKRLLRSWFMVDSMFFHNDFLQYVYVLISLSTRFV